MAPLDPQSGQLAGLIAAKDDTAQAFARRMDPGKVGVVLQQASANSRASVRLLVLDIAAAIPSEGASRAILGRLQDANQTVRSTANNLIGQCAQNSIVPDLFAALELPLDPAVKDTIARQIGTLGDEADVPRLRALSNRTRDSRYRSGLTAALARLHNEAARAEILHSLAQSEISVRLGALRDAEYSGDALLTAHFLSALLDRQNAFVLPFPNSLPIRVCDVAVTAMVSLGIRLSFPGRPMTPYTDAQLQEAAQVVRAMQATPAR